MYVSRDNRKTWKTLQDFTQDVSDFHSNHFFSKIEVSKISFVAVFSSWTTFYFTEGFDWWSGVPISGSSTWPVWETMLCMCDYVWLGHTFCFNSHRALLNSLLKFVPSFQGRNDFAIKVITEELGYLTWKEAFLCLSNEELPDQLRAKYCHLIIGRKTHLILHEIILTYFNKKLPRFSTIQPNWFLQGCLLMLERICQCWTE